MIIWFAFSIFSSFSLIKIKDLSPAYILDEYESCSIALNDLFSGDNLIFQISPENNTVLQSRSSNVQSTFNYSGIGESIRMVLVQSLFTDTSSNQLLIYQNIDTIFILYLNLQYQVLLNVSNATLESIHSCQYYENLGEPGVFVIASKLEYQLFFIPIDIKGFKPVFGKPALLNVSIEDLHLPRLVEGPINSMLLITGYRKTSPVMIFLNISNPNSPNVHQVIELEYIVDRYFEMFSVSNSDQFFVVVPAGSEVIRIDLGPNDFYFISNSLKLPVFACNVTSFQVNLFKQYLNIGLVNGFIISSFDFQQVYTKQEGRIFENVQFSYTKFNDYVLVERQGLLLLFELGDNFEITGNASFVKRHHGLTWGVFSYYQSNCVFLAGQNGSIELFNVTFYYPKLSFTSGRQSFRYNLTAVQEIPFKTLSTYFNVSRPERNTGYAQSYLSQSIEAYFENFAAQVWIPWQTYVIGGNLSVSSCQFELFDNCSYFKNELKWVSNFQEINKFEIGPNNYTSILGKNSIVILYNSSTVSIFNESSLLRSFSNLEIHIKNIIKCEVGYLLYGESTSDDFSGVIIYSQDPLFLEFSKETVKTRCVRISCSMLYIICESEIGVYTYKIIDKNIWYPLVIPNSKLPGTVQSSYLLQENYLAVLLNTSQLMIIDLDTFWIFYENIKGPILNLDYQATKVMSYTNIFLLDENSQVHMYDFYFNYLKKFSILPGEKVKLYNNYLISYTESQILIIDTLQWVTNSTLLNISLKHPTVFSGYSDETHPLQLYFLNETFVTLYEVPLNYNNLNLSISISDFNNISSIEYEGTIDCSIGNEFNQVNISIPVSLLVNGETIYKNQSKILEIQNSNMKYQCGQLFLLPLGDIFLGQDLSGKLQNSSKYVSLVKRFKPIRNFYPDQDYDVLFISQNYLLFVAVKMCQIFVLNFDMTGIYANQTFDGNGTLICDCHTGDIITDIESVDFVIGCTIIQNVYKAAELDTLAYVLVFAEYDFFGIRIQDIVKIDFPPMKMKTNGLNGGEFVVLTAEEFYIESLSTFYSNHLTITHGLIQNQSVLIYNHTCIFEVIFVLDNYYLSDFEVIYDPMFNIFYIYALDIYYGLRIIRFQRDQECKGSFFSSFESSIVGYSIIVCGTTLLIGMSNTDIIIYELHNWTHPVYQSSIFAYTDTYEAVQSSLRCSSNIFPHYAYLQMNNSGDFSVHIVDLQSSNLSNILTDYNLPNSTNDPLYLSTFLDANGTLVLISKSTKAIFSLNPFTLQIDTTKSCEKSFKESFTIEVSNTKSKVSEANFILTIEKYSQSDNIYNETFQFWMLLVIFLVVLVVSLLLYFVIKKCFHKDRAVKDSVLFDYKNEFQELEKIKS